MIVEAVLDALRASGRKLIFAESLTGGRLADAFISVPGASDVVLGAEIAYSNELKVQLLGVDEEVVAEKGAVSSEVALAMAQGVMAVGQASCDLDSGQVIAVSTTGNAGPSGEPVGLVYIAYTDGKKHKVRELNLTGDRSMIRDQTVAACVELIREQIGS